MPSPKSLGGYALHDPALDPVWAAAQDLDIAIGIHGGGTTNELGLDRFKSGKALRHLVSHTFEMMAAAASMIMGGPCERHPGLRVGFMEASGGWMAGWLDRMDRHYDDPHMNDTPLSLYPSEIFQRQCFIAFEPVERCLLPLADYVGPTNILWGSDYPHADGFPGAPKLVKDLGLSPDTQAAVLAGGAKRFYGLP
jgi:predicted TIM-barrel fold metal-dependent hydrolase